MESVARAVAAIERSGTLAALAASVRAFAAPYGYDRFVLYSSMPARGEVIDHLYWVEGDWFGDGAGVDVQTYLQRCPVNHHILETDQPFFWTKRGTGAQATYRVVAVPRGLGVHGLQVPVFGPHGLMGAMSLGGSHIDSTLGARLALGLIAQAALRRVSVLFAAAPESAAVHSRLTVREQAVLRWIAAGKRQADAAALLGLSQRTVENHLRRIRLRLGAATTAEALRMAIRAGDVRP